MSVPKYYEMYAPFLKSLEDGGVHSIKEIKQAIIEQIHLTENDLAELLPSGKQTVFDNRVGWARTYLKKAGLIESSSRAQFALSEEGRKALPDADIIDNKYLCKYASFRAFRKMDTEPDESVTESSEKSPEEILEDAFAELNASLADDLMTEIMKLEPTDFERLVVRLLLAMGYGSGIDDAGFVTQASNDGGIDGIIKEDQLGFSSIYIQAKRWDPNTSIARPEIQKFAGALQEQKAQKGLFITTATFSPGARRSADAAGIVLVDGKQLTKLMIKFNLGVSIEHVYEVKRLDTDFFTDGF